VIFVTVGTQLPFDRMVGLVDEWSGKNNVDVFAQVGPTTRRFNFVEQSSFLEPADFDKYFSEASLVVAHAGMGSILTALSYGKPIIIMPRQAGLGEHRNDHQMATAKRFASHPAVCVAWDEQSLIDHLTRMNSQDSKIAASISAYAPDSFINQLRHLIND